MSMQSTSEQECKDGMEAAAACGKQREEWERTEVVEGPRAVDQLLLRQGDEFLGTDGVSGLDGTGRRKSPVRKKRREAKSRSTIENMLPLESMGGASSKRTGSPARPTGTLVFDWSHNSLCSPVPAVVFADKATGHHMVSY